MIAEVRGSDWRIKEYTAKKTRIIIGTYCAVFWRTARCEMRGPAVVSHGWSEREARWLWPLHCCRPDSVSLELPVFASTPTTWPSTPSAPTTCYAGLMSAFWICSGSAPVTTWSVFFWWLLSISGCLLFRPISTLFLSLHYSTAASGTLKVIASRFIISSLFRSDFHLFFGVAFSQLWF